MVAAAPAVPLGARGGAGERAGESPAGMRSGVPSAAMPLNLGAFVQVQLDQLEDELKPTPAQSAAWIAYAERVGKFANQNVRSQFEARAARTTPATASAPEQLGRIAEGMRNRLKAVDEIVAFGNRALRHAYAGTEGGCGYTSFADGRDTDHHGRGNRRG